jgi:hypothetical protein
MKEEIRKHPTNQNKAEPAPISERYARHGITLCGAVINRPMKISLAKVKD